MRIQVIDGEIDACSICNAKDHWIEYVDVYGTIGLYCIKCDTLTLNQEPQTKYIYLAFKKKCQEIKSNKLTSQNI